MIDRRVLKFSASWCNPCKNLAKTLETVNTEVPIHELDIDEHTEQASEFGIRSVPTLVMMDGNTEVKRVSNSRMTKEELEAWLNG